MTDNGLNGNGKRESWHLSRGVPISLIGAIFFQTLAIGWWARGIEAQVAENRDDMQILYRRLNESKTEAAKDIDDIKKTNEQTNFRQWDRIRAADQKAALLDKTISELAISMKNVERDVGRIFTLLDRDRRQSRMDDAPQ